MEKPQSIFVLGMEENGGCWMSQERFYTSREQADEALLRKYGQKTHMKVFVLYPVPARTDGQSRKS